MKWLWPLLGCTPMFPDAPGKPWAKRRYDIHTGMDLYCERGTKVVAVEDGIVVLVEGFTGPNASDPSPHWNDTQAILVDGASGVVTYGEVKSLVELGQKVKAGEVIAIVETPVLKNFKGRPMTMLHFELMKPWTRQTFWWRLEDPKPPELRDPTRKLREAAGPELTHFDLATYDGESYR